jgi:hypothetical protein
MDMRYIPGSLRIPLQTVVPFDRGEVAVFTRRSGCRQQGWSASMLQLTPPWHTWGIVLLLRMTDSGHAC